MLCSGGHGVREEVGLGDRGVKRENINCDRICMSF